MMLLLNANRYAVWIKHLMIHAAAIKRKPLRGNYIHYISEMLPVGHSVL